jgi:hypothetical protein
MAFSFHRCVACGLIDAYSNDTRSNMPAPASRACGNVNAAGPL